MQFNATVRVQQRVPRIGGNGATGVFDLVPRPDLAFPLAIQLPPMELRRYARDVFVRRWGHQYGVWSASVVDRATIRLVVTKVV